jgi:hypothetical protein
MKVSKELDDVLRQASAEVDAWPKWKRSLDPIGDESRDRDRMLRHAEKDDKVEISAGRLDLEHLIAHKRALGASKEKKQ